MKAGDNMLKKRTKEELDINKINDSVSLLNKILKIMFILIIVTGLYLVLRLSKELKITETILVILKTILPVFIGLFVAWLFDPAVKFLKRKGIKRGVGALIIYAIFGAFFVILIAMIIPVLTEQINDFVGTIPSIFNTIKEWVVNLVENINIEGFDIK